MWAEKEAAAPGAAQPEQPQTQPKTETAPEELKVPDQKLPETLPVATPPVSPELPAGEEESLRQLRYGDKIKLYYEFKGKETERYYISTDGIATSRMFFHKGPSPQREKDVFIVVPTSESKVLRRLQTDLHHYVKDAKKLEESDALAKEEGYQQDVPQEIMNNWQHHKAMQGKPVCYGSAIQLVHEKTQQYVRISKQVDMSPPQAGMGGKSALSRTDFMRVYSLKLDPCSSPETNFMLSPCFKYQENDEVLAQDSFCFAYKDSQLLNKQFFLHFQPSAMRQDSQTLFNFYLTEEDKTPIRFELHEDSFLKSHVFGKLHEKALWITHIQASMYLSLKRIEKATDQDENELGDLIEPVDEALSQAFSLSFKKYDPNKPMTSDGLWVGYASSADSSEIVFRHIQYAVWLKPLQLEQLVRADNEEGTISEGSLFKLRVKSLGTYIQIRGGKQKRTGSAVPSRESTMLLELQKRKLQAKDDYYKSFKVVVASEQQQIVLFAMADLARYIRTFDMETAKRYGDYTEDALLRVLSKALKRLKLLCINGLPATLQQSCPYKQPLEAMQRVSFGNNWIVDERDGMHRLGGRTAAQAVPGRSQCRLQRERVHAQVAGTAVVPHIDLGQGQQGEQDVHFPEDHAHDTKIRTASPWLKPVDRPSSSESARGQGAAVGGGELRGDLA
ncbi:MAG: hypothetical protein P4M11_02650 [Candidatus Pacebacteria bacterium]|nr:hypothetical protein [Candidatus Paceibacterota bacterium]